MKWMFRILLVLVLLGTALFFWRGDEMLEKAVEEKFYERFIDVPTGNYLYELSSFDIKARSRSLTIKGIFLYPDPEYLSGIRSGRAEPDFIEKLEIDSVNINRIRMLRFIRKGELTVGELFINNPRLLLRIFPAKAGDVNGNEQEAIDLGPLNLGRINHTAIRNASVLVYHGLNKKEPILSADSTSITIWQMRLDSVTASSRTTADFRDMRLYSAAVSTSLGSEHSLHIRKLLLDTDREHLAADSLILDTRGFNPERRRYYGDKTAAYLTAGKLHMTGVDMMGLLKDRPLKARSLEMQSLNGMLYQREELLKEDTYPGKQDSIEIPRTDTLAAPFPATLLRDLSLPFSIRAVRISGISFLYREYSGFMAQPAEFELSEGNMIIEGLSNLERDVRRNQKVSASINGRIYDTAAFMLKAVMPLADTADRIDLSFQYGPMPFESLNRFIEPSGYMRFNSGHIDTIFCHVTLDVRGLQGNMAFAYRDLRIRVLRKAHRDEAALRRRPVASLAANGLIRNQNNPEARSFREASLSIPRRPQDSFISLLNRGIIQGVAESFAPGISRRISPAEKDN